MSVFRNLLMQSTGWQGKPSDWSDIRKDCPANSIALYAGVKSDYSAYDNLGFTATVSNSGQYKVYIDETLYGTYNSGAQCSITWSTSGITTGDDITTPSALKAHKIWIEPATAGNNITVFHCDRVAASGTEQQGILWAHFNLSNIISIRRLFSRENYYQNKQVLSTTAKNNKIFVDTNLETAFEKCENLEYLPVLQGNGTSLYTANGLFNSCKKIKEISLSDMEISTYFYMFFDCNNLEKIKARNVLLNSTNVSSSNVYVRCYKLKNILPAVYGSAITSAVNYITNASELEDTIIDMSNATSLKRFTSASSAQYFMAGLKGLRVSSSAPFDNATSPQIDVSYTGMDKVALVQLFNDLPTVSGGQKIQITGATGASDLTAEERAIAENKGWEIMG